MKSNLIHATDPCQSAIKTVFFIVKANGGVPIQIAIGTIGMKATKERERSEFHN